MALTAAHIDNDIAEAEAARADAQAQLDAAIAAAKTANDRVNRRRERVAKWDAAVEGFRQAKAALESVG